MYGASGVHKKASPQAKEPGGRNVRKHQRNGRGPKQGKTYVVKKALSPTPLTYLHYSSSSSVEPDFGPGAQRQPDPVNIQIKQQFHEAQCPLSRQAVHVPHNQPPTARQSMVPTQPVLVQRGSPLSHASRQQSGTGQLSIAETLRQLSRHRPPRGVTQSPSGCNQHTARPSQRPSKRHMTTVNAGDRYGPFSNGSHTPMHAHHQHPARLDRTELQLPNPASLRNSRHNVQHTPVGAFAGGAPRNGQDAGSSYASRMSGQQVERKQASSRGTGAKKTDLATSPQHSLLSHPNHKVGVHELVNGHESSFDESEMAVEAKQRVNSKIARARLSNQNMQIGGHSSFVLQHQITFDTENSTNIMASTQRQGVPWHRAQHQSFQLDSEQKLLDNYKSVDLAELIRDNVPPSQASVSQALNQANQTSRHQMRLPSLPYAAPNSSIFHLLQKSHQAQRAVNFNAFKKQSQCDAQSKFPASPAKTKRSSRIHLMAGGSLQDMVSDSISYTAGSSVGFSLARGPPSRKVPLDSLQQKTGGFQGPERTVDALEYSNSQSSQRHPGDGQAYMLQAESDFNPFGVNVVLEEASDSQSGACTFHSFQDPYSFGSHESRRQAQIIRIQNDPRRQRKFLKRIEPAKRMLEAKLKPAASSIEQTPTVPQGSPRSPRADQSGVTDPDLRVSPSVYQLINAPPHPERVELAPILSGLLEQQNRNAQRLNKARGQQKQTSLSKSQRPSYSQLQTDDDISSVQCVNLIADQAPAFSTAARTVGEDSERRSVPLREAGPPTSARTPLPLRKGGPQQEDGRQSKLDVEPASEQEAGPDRRVGDPGLLAELAREHGAYITAFIESLEAKAKQRYAHVGAVKSKGGTDYPFPSMGYFRKEKKAQDRTMYADFAASLCGEGEVRGRALVATVKEEPDRQEEELRLQFTEHVKFLSQGQQQGLQGDEGGVLVDNLNKKPGATYTFLELSKIEEHVFIDNATQFDKKVLYREMNKAANKNSTGERFWDHPEYQYFIQCHMDQDVPLPILSHVANRTLSLANYTLSPGHVKGLNRAAEFLESVINRVRFDNCGIDDGEMSSLLQAFSKFKDFKSIIYRFNEFSDASMEGLRPILVKAFPNHLQELRISNCRMTPQVTGELVGAITQKCFLKSLELAKAPISKDVLKKIADYAAVSKHLEELDVSWNSLPPDWFPYFLGQIQTNKKLRILSLAHNNLVESSLSAAVLTEGQRTVADLLFRLVRHGKRLIHLDLTSTNLAEQILEQMLPGIKRSRTLMSVHFSGNPGVTKRVQQEAQRILKAKAVVPKQALNLQRCLSQATLKKYAHHFVQESIKIKQLNNLKRIVQNGSTDDSFFADDQKLIFTRYLMHKQEIPGSAQWRMVTDKKEHCWICDKEIKGYIFWHKGMHKQPGAMFALDDQEQTNIYNQLGEIKSAGNPVVCGQFTDWQPRQMYRLVDFLQMRGPPDEVLTDENIFEVLMRDKKFDAVDGVNKFGDMRKKHLDMVAEYRKTRLLELYEKWGVALSKHFLYKKPFLINSHHVRHLPFQEVWLLPVFIKSGRQLFVVQHGNIPQTVQLFSKIVSFREDDLITQTKEQQSSTIQRMFKKEISVFAQWRTDTEATRDKCLDHDAEYWKLGRLIASDIDDRALTEKVLWEHFLFLKDIYIELAAETAFPYVSQLGFGDFCVRCEMLDKHLKLGDVDRHFLAALWEEGAKVKQINMCRFMFLEALVRVADCKYRTPGIVSTFAEALEKLIREDIRPHWRSENWHGYRLDWLWKVDVNDTFQSNILGMRSVYDGILKGQKGKPRKYVTLEDCINIFAKHLDVGLSESQVVWCFGMSKMTNALERRQEKKRPLPTDLEFVEFLELIGRLSQAKFKGSEAEDQMTPAQKIECILEDLFAMAGLQLNEVVFSEGEESSPQTSESEEDVPPGQPHDVAVYDGPN